MGFLDRLFGTEEPQQAPPAPRAARTTDTARSADEVALERYRYLLRTAPPETIEQVHREAFAKLTDEQRAVIYEELSRGAQTGERPLSSEPDTLARAATRAELRQPGTMERAFGGAQANGAYGRQGPGFGSMVAGSLLGTVAGYVIGSALVSAFLPWDGGADSASADNSGDNASGDSGSDTGSDSGSGDSGDFGGGDSGGFDGGGGGWGDFGGGGGDFGGGDFGGF